MSEHSNVLSNAVNMSTLSAGGSPASRGPFGQNSVTTRLPPPGEHDAMLAPSYSPGPNNCAEEDRIDELARFFPSTFGSLDRYSRPSTPGPSPGYHHATPSTNKFELMVRRAKAKQAHAVGMLAREIGKRAEAQASIQAISGLLQDGMTKTISAL